MSMINRIQRFLRSPQGRKAIDQAQRYAQKPENQAKLRKMVAKLRGRRLRHDVYGEGFPPTESTGNRLEYRGSALRRHSVEDV